MEKPTDHPAPLERWGWYSIGINLALTTVHASIAVASGSLAVTAELVYNPTDLLAAVVVLLGLKLSGRRSRRFPNGLYKVENRVTAILAILIFVTDRREEEGSTRSRVAGGQQDSRGAGEAKSLRQGAAYVLRDTAAVIRESNIETLAGAIASRRTALGGTGKQDFISASFRLCASFPVEDGGGRTLP